MSQPLTHWPLARDQAKERQAQAAGEPQGAKVSSGNFTEQTGNTRDQIGEAVADFVHGHQPNHRRP